MRVLSSKKKYGRGIRGRVAEYFAMKDDAATTYLVEILGGITIFLAKLSFFSLDAGGTIQMEAECHNETFAEKHMDDWKTMDAFAIGLASGVASITMGVLAKVPIGVGPRLSFAIAFRKLFCTAPSLTRAGGMAANIIVGWVYVVIVLLAKKFNGFIAVPEDFRLGMAAGIAAYICVSATIGTRLLSIVNVEFEPVPEDQIPFSNHTLTERSDQVRMPVLTIAGLVLLTITQVRIKRRLTMAWSVLLIVLLIALISCIVRASFSPDEFRKVNIARGPLSDVGVVPSFKSWDKDNSFYVFQYVLNLSVEKLFDSFATVTAIALLLVVSNLGYNKSIFGQAMNDSDKVSRALIVDAVVNILVGPFLGTTLLSPSLESIVAIIAGAKTGLAAVIAGLLFLATSPVITYVSVLFPPEAVNPPVIYAAVFTFRSIQYMDFRRPALFFPSLLVIILIPMSFDIALSSSICYIILFLSWLLSKYWICINPKMIILVGICLTLILSKSSMTKSIYGLIVGIGIYTAVVLILYGVLSYKPFRRRFKKLCGNRDSDHYFEEDVVHLPYSSNNAVKDRIQPNSRSALLRETHSLLQTTGESSRNNSPTSAATSRDSSLFRNSPLARLTRHLGTQSSATDVPSTEQSSNVSNRRLPQFFPKTNSGLSAPSFGNLDPNQTPQTVVNNGVLPVPQPSQNSPNNREGGVPSPEDLAIV